MTSLKFFSNQDQLKETSDVYYCKLPDISNLSHLIKSELLCLSMNILHGDNKLPMQRGFFKNSMYN